MSDARVEEVIALVRASGGRSTAARRAILDALFDESAGHPTAERITSRVRRTQPDVAESTVYRFLDELARLGVVEQVRVDDGPGAYHLADESAHHHLRCTSCGSMTEISDRTFGALRQSVRRATGFEIDAHHVTLTGACARCAAER